MSDEVDYLLSIPGKKRCAAMVAGCPLILQTKMMLGSSLTTWKVPWMMRYLPVLEDVKKRTAETTDGLFDCICQLVCCALLGDGSDVAVEFEAQHRLICAILDSDTELWKEILKVSWDKGVSHLLEICHTYYAIESGAAAMGVGKTINAVQKFH